MQDRGPPLCSNSLPYSHRCLLQHRQPKRAPEGTHGSAQDAIQLGRGYPRGGLEVGPVCVLPSIHPVSTRPPVSGHVCLASYRTLDEPFGQRIPLSALPRGSYSRDYEAFPGRT